MNFPHFLLSVYICGSVTASICVAIREIADATEYYRSVMRAIDEDACDCPKPLWSFTVTEALGAVYLWPIFLARPDWFLSAK